MRWLLLALLLTSCVAVQKPVQTPVPTTTPAPEYATAMATALCSRDAAYVAEHVTGRLAASEPQLRNYFDTLVECSGIRYIAPDPISGSTRYLFVLIEDGASIPYEFTFNDALQCVDVR